MTRTTKKQKMQVDLTQPVNLQPSADDCFGNLWDPSCRDCYICGAATVCGAVFQDTLRAREKALSEKDGPFLDEVRELTVQEWNHIEGSIQYQHEHGTPVKTAAVIDDVQQRMRTRDRMLAVDRVRAFVAARVQIFTRDGHFYHRANSTQP